MILDIVWLAALGLMMWLGHLKGCARQLIGLVAMVAVYFTASPLATVVRTVVFAREGITFPGVEMASLAIAGVIVFIIVYVMGRLFISSLCSVSTHLERVDRVLGAVLGTLKGILLVYLVLCAMVYAETPLTTALPALGQQLSQSGGVAVARRYNVITHMRYPELGDLRLALLAFDGQGVGAASSEGEPRELAEDETVQRLMQHPDFISLTQDEAIIRAAQARDTSRLLTDPRVLRLLADPEFRALLDRPDVQRLIAP